MTTTPTRPDNRRNGTNPFPPAASNLADLCPLDAGVLTAGAALSSAAAALAVLADVLPTWSRPYLYGVAAGHNGAPRLRIGIECPNRERLIDVGDALFTHDPDVEDGDLFTTVRATVAGTPVVAFCNIERGR